VLRLVYKDELPVKKPRVHGGVEYLYTRIYRLCTWGCTKCIHPGGDEVCSPANDWWYLV